MNHVASMPVSQFQAPGHRHSLTNLMQQAIAAVQIGDCVTARQLLSQAIVRIDGCALRGTADGPGPSIDWVADCTAQSVLYQELTNALNVLP